MPTSPFQRAAQDGLNQPEGSSVAGSGVGDRGKRGKRKSKPTGSRRNQKQEVKERYAKAREDAQLTGVIPTTPEGAVRPEQVPPSAQGAQPVLPGLLKQAIRNGWEVPDERKPGHVDELSGILDDPEQPAKAKIAAFNALRMADKDQYERDHPEQAGKARGGATVVNTNTTVVSNTTNVFDDIERDIQLITGARSTTGAVDAAAVGGVPPDGAAKPVDEAQADRAEAPPEAD